MGKEGRKSHGRKVLASAQRILQLEVGLLHSVKEAHSGGKRKRAWTGHRRILSAQLGRPELPMMNASLFGSPSATSVPTANTKSGFGQF